MSFKNASLLAALSLIAITLTACNWDGPPPLQEDTTNESGNPGNSPGTGGTGKIELIPYTNPLFSWDNDLQTTTASLQYIVRDAQGIPMDVTDYDKTITVDGDVINPTDEAILKQNSQELAVNIYLSMVLDASSSMVNQQPEAFTPMINAAQNSYDETINIWKSRKGEIKFSVLWFNNIMHQSYDTENHKWLPSDLSTITPPPLDGAYTKLYSGVSSMSSFLKKERDNGIFTDPRDQYVMLVFSDGKDTYSHVDNAIQSPKTTRSTVNGASYYEFGTAKIDPDKQVTQTVDLIKAVPNLTAHVIALGSDIDRDGLKKIASAGKGLYLENPNRDSIDQLFARVLKEFTLLQTLGYKFPFTDGEHTLILKVTSKQTGQSDDYTIKFRVSGSTTQLIN